MNTVKRKHYKVTVNTNTVRTSVLEVMNLSSSCYDTIIFSSLNPKEGSLDYFTQTILQTDCKSVVADTG